MRHLRRIERMGSARTKRRKVTRSYRLPWDDWQARLKAKLAMSYYEGIPHTKCATCAAYTHASTATAGWRCSGCIDTDHAVALEREAIAAYLENLFGFWSPGAEAVTAIRAGEHHREGK